MVAAAAWVLARALASYAVPGRPLRISGALAVLALLFLVCDSSPTTLTSRQSAWSPSSSATLAADSMGLAALALFIAPLLVTQLAFRRYAGIRATYLQTVRALARVTEVGGYVEAGHAHRVGRLAVAVGRELGMSETELLELEYAALMHDIGQLSLRGPIPGGQPCWPRRRISAASPSWAPG